MRRQRGEDGHGVLIGAGAKILGEMRSASRGALRKAEDFVDGLAKDFQSFEQSS